MKELSIFIDESGDFGPYAEYSPYYIVTMVFHDQDENINSNILDFEQALHYLGLEEHCVHTGPIIRREENYRYLTIEERRKVLNKIVGFARKLPIKYKSFHITKQKNSDVISDKKKLYRQIASFFSQKFIELEKYQVIKVYYDNGQIELTKILTSVFSAILPNVEFRKVLPKDYKLFQVADLFCTMELLKMKKNDNALTPSDVKIFGSYQMLKKNYLKPISKKEYQ